MLLSIQGVLLYKTPCVFLRKCRTKSEMGVISRLAVAGKKDSLTTKARRHKDSAGMEEQYKDRRAVRK